MGEVPEWYSLIRAAKFLGCTPWDLLAQPVVWRDWSLMAERAENEAEKQQHAAAQRKSK